MDENEKRIVLRILDANANRCAEGLRVVEEIVRFSMNDADLLKGIKEIRHSVRLGMEAVTSRPFEFRDSVGDVGRTFSTQTENLRKSIESVSRANFARSEEALRVMEEFGKVVDPGHAAVFKRLRFELYTLERSFFKRRDSVVRLPERPFLYGILDRSYVERSRVAETAAAMIDGGVDLVQYRAKGIDPDEMRSDLVELLSNAERSRVPVIVNDDPLLASEVGAQGVHVGEDDPSPEEARIILGPGRIVGMSVHSFEELDGIPPGIVDYIAVGAVFPSETKPDVEVIGLENLRRFAEASSHCVVAIGGITLDGVGAVLDSGACGIALISALLRGDVAENCSSFKRSMENWKESKGFTTDGEND